MNYQQTIDYLFSQLPMFTRIGAAAYKPNLNNIIALCEAIDNPHLKFKSIHVAGTNGKGSTCNMLASILQEQGYKTGLFTSPHIFDFRERIRINGAVIDEQFVIDFVAQIKTVTLTIAPSFFEVTTAMAFSYFAQQAVDYAVVEVGMGGLLDSTNIITPELCIITNIGLDHTQFLGNSIAEIATQKAGIMKSQIPVVIGANDNECIKVFNDIALHKNAPLYDATTVYDIVKYKEDSYSHQYIKAVNKAKMNITAFEFNLLGTYQLENIKTVLLSCDVLNDRGIKVSDSAITSGLKNIKANTNFRGRFDILQTKPLLIADVAHNENGIEKLMSQINSLKFNQLHIICGFVQDKDVSKIINHLPNSAQYYLTQAQIPRALPVSDLSQYFNDTYTKVQQYENINTALESATKMASKNDLILICGSFFILAELNVEQFVQ